MKSNPFFSHKIFAKLLTMMNSLLNEPIDPFAVESSSSGKLLRYASQNSLDESSQKQIPKSKCQERPPYRNSIHPHKALEVLNIMRMQKILCDIVLVADDVEVHAHRTILAGCSPYFYAMFTKFEERKLDRVVIKEIDSLALELLIEYVYTSEILVTEDNVQSLLPAANLLQLSPVRDACCDFLENQLHPTNCLGIRAFADLHGCLNLLSQSEAYVEQHFPEVVEGEEFLALPVSQVIRLIQSDKLMIVEEKVFECVINWVQHDVENRKTHLPLLMEHVRLPLTSAEYLMQRVHQEPLFSNNPLCKDYLLEAYRYHLLPTESRASLKSVRVVPRQTNSRKALLVVGGQAPKAIRSVECFDFKEQKWCECADMPTRRCRAGLALVENKVYAVGGFNGSLRVKTVEVYDTQSDSWSTGPPMSARRSTLGVAVLGTKIYAVGGFDGSIGLETAEFLDIRTAEKWEPIASMSTRRSSVGVGVLDGLLFAVGGYDGDSRQCLSTVEYYNPETDMWYLIAEMTCKRSGAGVGVMDGVLYAVGGHDGPVVRNTVEAYDPASGRWKLIANMAFCRRNAGVVSHNGFLYVVGGDDGTANLSSVEVYCPKTNSWSLLTKSMGIGRSYAGVVLIDRPTRLKS